MPVLPYATAPRGRVAIVASRYNDLIVRALIDGARDALNESGYGEDAVDLLWLPGAFELPLGADRALASGRYLGVVALGCVIRGATAHFDYVSRGATQGLLDIALEYGKPIGLGVLTVDTLEQALERAGGKAGNKGAEAARALVEQLRLYAALESAP